MPAYFPYPQTSLILNEDSSYRIETNPEGLSLYANDDNALIYKLEEPLLLAQGVADMNQRIHIAFLKSTGELCYTIISPNRDSHTTILGKLDTKSNRYARLFLLPVNHVVHIFYASSHRSLPDVWRVTHLFWNSQHWQSAQLGEVVHPHHPLFHILLDSKLNIHVLMMTYLGSHSALLTSFFNGSFHIWSKRQESLSIPREVVDMTALMLPGNAAYVFWAAKQPGSDHFEIGCASRRQADDFMSSWQSETNPQNNISGPWRGLGALYSGGIIHLLSHGGQTSLLQQFTLQKWTVSASSFPPGAPLTIVKKENLLINYSNWLKQSADSPHPLFAKLTGLPAQDIMTPNPATDNFNPSQPAAMPAAIPATAQATVTFPSTVLAPQQDQDNASRHDPTPDLSQSTEPATPLDRVETPAAAISIPDPASAANASTSTPNEIAKPAGLELLHSLLGGISDVSNSVTENLHSLEKKFELLPHILGDLMNQNEETLKKLRSLDDKLTEIKSQRELAANKKGIWDRWFT